MEPEVKTVVPTGTVTFLFSDVVGSTRLWAQDSSAMATSLETHDAIFTEVISRHDGHIFSTAGDSFAAAFARASAAIECAEALQRAIQEADWGTGPALSVRIGLHVGEADERHGNYFGSAVNQAQRVMAVAHGGQCVLTDGVRDAAGVETTDLGVHVLRDIDVPVHLNQIGTVEFPPLWTVGVGIVALPSPRTSLVGREESVEEVRRLVGANRLVTLVGVGGCGKTRLAIEVAYREVPTHPDGIWFVDLSTITDEIALPGAFASALKLSVAADAVATDQIVNYLAPRDALIVVDNCEHVVDIVAEFVDVLIERTPRLRVLATSRESLVVDGEYTWKVPSLARGESSPAGQLFIERAAASGASLALDHHELAVIDQIVERLDGIPLAIELAAARCRSMAPSEILGLLDDRFALLSGGARRLRQRQATLEGAVQWSYDLLSDEDKAMLRTLSVFQGGFAIDDVAAVAGLSGAHTRNLIDSLTSKSLIDIVRDAKGDLRHRLLETIRLFALARLIDAGDAIDTRDRHLARFVSDPACHSLEEWLSVDRTFRLDREYENFRSAISWAIERERVNDAVLLAATGSEAAAAKGEIQLCINVLRLPTTLEPRDRGFVQTELGWALLIQGQVDESRAPLQEALALNDHGLHDYGSFALSIEASRRLIADGDIKGCFEYHERAHQLAYEQPGVNLRATNDIFLSSLRSWLLDFDGAIRIVDDAIAMAPNYGFRHLLEAYRAWAMLCQGRVDDAVAAARAFTPAPGGSQWAHANMIFQHCIFAHLDGPTVAAQSLQKVMREDMARRPELAGEMLTALAYFEFLDDQMDRAAELISSAYSFAASPIASWILQVRDGATPETALELIERQYAEFPVAARIENSRRNAERLLTEEHERWSR